MIYAISVIKQKYKYELVIEQIHTSSL